MHLAQRLRFLKASLRINTPGCIREIRSRLGDLPSRSNRRPGLERRDWHVAKAGMDTHCVLYLARTIASSMLTQRPQIIASSKHLDVLPSTIGSMDRVDWIPVDILADVIVE